VAQRVSGVIALLFYDRDTRRGEWSAARPGRTLPPGKTRYPFYRIYIYIYIYIYIFRFHLQNGSFEILVHGVIFQMTINIRMFLDYKIMA